jgi:hypothetical protein
MTFDTGSVAPTIPIMLQLPTLRGGGRRRRAHHDETVGCLCRTSHVRFAAWRSLSLAFAAAHWQIAPHNITI